MVRLKWLECNLAQVWSEPNGICEWSAAHEKSPVTEGGASYTRRLGEKRRTRRARNQCAPALRGSAILRLWDTRLFASTSSLTASAHSRERRQRLRRCLQEPGLRAVNSPGPPS